MKKVKLIAILAFAGLVIVGLAVIFPLANSAQAHTGSDDMIGHCQEMMGGDMMGTGMMGGWGGSSLGLNNPVTLQRVAGTLGITLEELQTRLTRGETIAQIASSKNVDARLVVTAILAPESEILQVRVKYGYLTQALAQAILEQSRLWTERAIQTPFSSYYNPAIRPSAYGGQGYWGYGPGGGMMGGEMMGGGMMGRGRNGMMGRLGNGMIGGWGGRGMMGW